MYQVIVIATFKAVPHYEAARMSLGLYSSQIMAAEIAEKYRMFIWDDMIGGEIERMFSGAVKLTYDVREAPTNA